MIFVKWIFTKCVVFGFLCAALADCCAGQTGQTINVACSCLRRLPPVEPTELCEPSLTSLIPSIAIGTGDFSVGQDCIVSGQVTNLSYEGAASEILSDDSLLNDVADGGDKHRGMVDQILQDHGEFYSRKNLGDIAMVVGIAGVMANSNIDRFMTFDLYHENVRNANTDEWLENLHKPKLFGDAYYAIPVYAGAFLTGELMSQYEKTQLIGDWGSRSLRTLVVGGPPLLVLQQFTGGSRPGEANHGSRWRPFHDDNGVSGHSFVGAVPFLSAAYQTKNKFFRRSLIAASALPAVSRLNDDAHYASQAMLGWSLAFFAANAVNRTELQNGPLRLGITTLDGSPQMAASYEW